MAELPIVRRFPALGKFARVAIGVYPTPVERVTLRDGRTLLVKRDDRCGTLLGGNKVRGLEWLLGYVGRGTRVLTVGARGSTHALATATYAGALGAHVTVVRWNQEMNTAAKRVDALLRHRARVIDARSVPAAYAVAGALRVDPRTWWIPAGGATPVAALGHVNAALELADQIAAGDVEEPETIVVPFGTGATSAGLTLGVRIAGLATRVVAVRVVPRIIGRTGRVVRLARDTATLIERATGERVPRVRAADFTIAHEFFGGAYGKALPALPDEGALALAGIQLDDTYTRKAFAAAVGLSTQRTLLWLTFDGRILEG